MVAGELRSAFGEAVVRASLEHHVGLDEGVEAVVVGGVVVTEAAASDGVLDGVALSLGVVAVEDELGANLPVAVPVVMEVVHIRVGDAVGVDWMPAMPWL